MRVGPLQVIQEEREWLPFAGECGDETLDVQVEAVLRPFDDRAEKEDDQKTA